MNFSPAGGTRPSTLIGPHAIMPLSGSAEMPPAAVTPGSSARRGQSWRYDSRTAAPSACFGGVSVISIVRTPCGAKPGSTFCSRMKLRISNPAPTSTMTDSASSATTSSRRRFCPRPQSAPAPEPRAASFNDS